MQPRPSFIPQVHSPRTTGYNPFPFLLSSRNLREEHRITRQETIISQAKSTHCETGKSRWRRSAIPRIEPQGLMFKKLLFSFPFFFCCWKTACVCCVLSLSLSSLTLSPSDSLLFSLSIAARFSAQHQHPRNKKTHRKTLERRGWGLGVARVWQRLQGRTHSAADFSSFFLIVNGGFQLSHLRAVEQMGGRGA